MEVNTEIIPQIQNKVSGGGIGIIYRKFANVVSLAALVTIAVMTSVIGFKAIAAGSPNNIPKVNKLDKNGKVVKDKAGNPVKIDEPLIMGTIITTMALAAILTVDIWGPALKTGMNLLRAPPRLLGLGAAVAIAVAIIIMRETFLANAKKEKEKQADLTFWWGVLAGSGIVGTLAVFGMLYILGPAALMSA